MTGCSSNPDFSHNPEWMVSQAQRFIDEAVNQRQQPFFLYFAATLVHGPDASDALKDYDYSETPKGTLSQSELPDDTAMMTRDEILDNAQGGEDVKGVWMDDVCHNCHLCFVT